MTAPLEIPRKLAATPSEDPKYSVQVKNGAGEDITLADPRSTRALVALMNQHAVNGGAACHWGGPAAMAELMSALHGLIFADKSGHWANQFNFINDAGHAENGLYALRANYGFDNLSFDDLKGFRGIESKLTGHGESHLNPQQVFVSNGPLGSGPGIAQGLCFADKITRNDRVTICAMSDGASMEGEAKEAFAAIPGLASKGKMNPFVLAISDNNTKLSGRIDGDSFSMAPSMESLATLGWDLRVIENGHDLESVYQACEKAIIDAKANSKKPIALIVKTIKGYGVAKTAEAASGGHGYPLKKDDGKIVDFVNEIYGNETPDEFLQWAQSLMPGDSKPESKPTGVPKEKIQVGIANALNEMMEKGYPLFSVSADLQGSTGVAGFHKKHPERFVEVGVAESNMISMAAGLSKQGYIAIADTFAQFGVTKGNLPLTMANLSQAPIICIFSHTGFQDAADGASHQATTYFSAVSSIPHTKVICCSCSGEAYKYLTHAIETQKADRVAGKNGDSYVFFVGRENYPSKWTESELPEYGKTQTLRKGSDVTLVTAGSLLGEAIEACELLENQGISTTLINNPFINEPDVEAISTALGQTSGKLVTLEDHQVLGGMGALLVQKLSNMPNRGELNQALNLGIKGEFGRSAYLAKHLYRHQDIDAAGISQSIRKFLA